MDVITEPPLPAFVNIQTCGYMPLDVRRLLGSEFFSDSTAEEFRAGIALWCNSWHQVPAASLPDNDNALANLAGYGRDIESWKRVRDQALHGFVRCEADGRLYHPLIADKALKAYGDLTIAEETGRVGGIKSGASRRAKRDGEVQPELALGDAKAPSKAPSNFDDESANPPSKGGLNQMNECNEGIEGKEGKKEQPDALRAVDVSILFNRFWARYPHKIGKHGDKGARKSFDRVMKSGVTFEKIMAGLELYIRTKPADRPWCNPATWLNQGRWDDEPAAGGNAKPAPDPNQKLSYELPVHGGRVTAAMCPAAHMKQHVGKVYIQHDSDEWHAWLFYVGEDARKRGVDPPFVSTNFSSKDGKGWSFPDRWPPGYVQKKQASEQHMGA